MTVVIATRRPFLTFSGLLSVKIGVAAQLRREGDRRLCLTSLYLPFFFGFRIEIRAEAVALELVVREEGVEGALVGLARVAEVDRPGDDVTAGRHLRDALLPSADRLEAGHRARDVAVLSGTPAPASSSSCR